MPALLNVAISRTKSRLYVIGNLEAWKDQLYFSALADRVTRDGRIRWITSGACGRGTPFDK